MFLVQKKIKILMIMNILKTNNTMILKNTAALHWCIYKLMYNNTF